MSQRRRRLLTTLAAGTTAVVAGCLSGGNDIDPATIGAGEEDDALAPPTIGSGEIGVAVFADFACPACQVFNDETKPQLIEQYAETDTIQLVHRDLVLGQFEWSQAAANAAWAVKAAAGTDAFWTFTDAIYQHQAELLEETTEAVELIETIAEETNGLGDQARAAADDGTYDDRIAADGELYDQLEPQRRTPTVFVDGGVVDAGEELVGIEDIDAAIDAAQ